MLLPGLGKWDSWLGFGMTLCFPNFFKMRLSEHHNMRPIKELLRATRSQKSVDQDRGRPLESNGFAVELGSVTRLHQTNFVTPGMATTASGGTPSQV